MDKEKFHIPMPDEQTIRTQVEQIVFEGSEQKESFLSYMKSMYQQIGLRHLFIDHSKLVLILFIVFSLISIFFIQPLSVQVQVNDWYAFIFLISPIVFLVFSFYTYSNQIMNGTYDVEMVCKYNVYQIIAFRMLIFSIVSIVMNTMTLSIIVMANEDIQFMRAFMISITGLFSFSILYLYAMMKRRSTLAVAILIIGWFLGNILFRALSEKLYSNVLVSMPLLVYVIVLVCVIFGYIMHLNRLLYFKHTEGAL